MTPPHSVIVSAVVLAVAGFASAAPTIDDFDRAWRAARNYQIPKSTEIEWRETTHPTMTAEEIDAAIARLGSEPRESERAVLEGQRWLLNAGPSVSTYHLWYLSDRQFRLNEDIPNAEWSPQIDATVNGNEGWIYASDRSVAVVDLNRPPPGRNPRVHVDTINALKSNLLTSGMGFGMSQLEVRSFEIDQDEWRAILTLPDSGVRFRLSGYYRPENDQFVVRAGQFAAPEYPETDGKSLEYSGHEFNAALGQVVARRFVHKDRNGRPIRSIELDLLDRFDTALFAGIAAVPSPARNDPTRPERQIRRIDDYRPATAVTTTLDSDTGAVVSNEPLASVTNRQSANAWRWTGWVILPVLVAAFVVVRMKRSV